MALLKLGTLEDWLCELENLGVGEIFLNTVIGMAAQAMTLRQWKKPRSVNIPVIACGGAGHQSDFLECFSKTEVLQCCG